MAEKLNYLRDRLVNAFWMLRHGQFDLFVDGFRMEASLRLNNLHDVLLGRRGFDVSKFPGSRYRNLRRVLPPSPRPTRAVPAPTLSLTVSDDVLRAELGAQRAALNIAEPGH